MNIEVAFSIHFIPLHTGTCMQAELDVKDNQYHIKNVK